MKVGACKRIFIENRGFRTYILQNFQAFWWKLWSNLSFWSWKLSYFLKKCLLLEGKCHIFLSNEGLVNGLVPQLGVMWTGDEARKGGLEGCTSLYPLVRWVPPWAGISASCFLALPQTSLKFPNEYGVKSLDKL